MSDRFGNLIDKARGLDFLGIVRSEDVGLDPAVVHHYTPSGNRCLARILRDMKIKPVDAIIDIGCGKGSAMRTMLKFPFGQVEGVELCPQTAAIAVRNFKRLRARNVAIHVCDARKFTGLGKYSIYYMYNPFPESVMISFMELLEEEIKDAEYEKIILYNNPTCNDIIVRSGAFSRVCVYPDHNRNGIFVYSNREYTNSRLRL